MWCEGEATWLGLGGVRRELRPSLTYRRTDGAAADATGRPLPCWLLGHSRGVHTSPHARCSLARRSSSALLLPHHTRGPLPCTVTWPPAEARAKNWVLTLHTTASAENFPPQCLLVTAPLCQQGAEPQKRWKQWMMAWR